MMRPRYNGEVEIPLVNEEQRLLEQRLLASSPYPWTALAQQGTPPESRPVLVNGHPPHAQAHPTRTPTEISEAIRILDESHKFSMTELRIRMDSLHREYSREHEKYSRERQLLRTNLQQALCSQEVCSDPVNLPLPGLYQPQSMMPANVTPMMASAAASMPTTTSVAAMQAPPPGSLYLDNASNSVMEAAPANIAFGGADMMVSHLATVSAASLSQQSQPQAQPQSVVPTAAPPPMTSSVAMTSSLTPLQYAAVLPGSRYQIQVNPDGSHQVIHVQQPPSAPLTVVTTASSSSTTS